MPTSEDICGVEVPAGLPVLSRGRHRDPEQGSCLMEYVSVLAGERFSDRPRCTHPALARLAQQVNDTVADTARPRLARLAPGLIGTDIDDPQLPHVIVERCVAAALGVAPDDARLARLARRTRRRRERAGQQHRSRVRRGLRRVAIALAGQMIDPAYRSLDAVLAARGVGHRDRVRAATLEDAIRAVREHLGLAPVAAVAAGRSGVVVEQG